MWDLTGMYVRGLYLGSIPVQGRVESSRVKYGGGIQHTVVLDEAIMVYNARRERVLLDHETVTRVWSQPEVPNDVEEDWLRAHEGWENMGCEFDPKIV